MKYQFILLLILGLLSCGDGENKPESPVDDRDDNGVVLNINLTGSLQNGAFSPDGKTILFTRFIDGYNSEISELYKYNLETEALTLLVADGSGNINLPGSSWVDGNIVFASTRDPHDEIYMIPEGGSPDDELKITEREGKVAYEPSLSPDGEWVVFESHLFDVEGDGIIMKYRVDGTSDYIPLTADGEDNRQPNWSPSNNKILYQRFDNNQWNIWIMNIDGSSATQLTRNLGNCTDASFSDDGELIVFSSDYEVDIANIYSISITGNNPDQLTDFKGYDGAPSISSDGSKLIFESINKDPDESSGTKLVLLNL